MRVAITVAFMLVSGAVLCSAAGAQESQVDKVKACASVQEDAARLKCFDAAVEAMKTTTPAGRTIVKVPGPDVSTTSIVPKEKTPDRITVSVTAIDTGADGKLHFTLSNGETWRQTDSPPLKNLGKGPWEAELRKAAMGSYMLRIGNKAAVRVAQVK
jgi:hypothetical protein